MRPKPKKYIPGILSSQYQVTSSGVMSLSPMLQGGKVQVVTAKALPQQYHHFAIDAYRVPTGRKPTREKQAKSEAQVLLDTLRASIQGATW